jgi:hypothetical protein
MYFSVPICLLEFPMLVIALALAATQGVTMSGKDKQNAPAHVATSPVKCAAFRKNPDGSWTSVRDTKIAAVHMSSGGTFFPGVQLDGVDVGASLNAKCKDKADGPVGNAGS